MDWLTFISNIVASLVWPATVIALVVLLKDQLPRIISSIRKVKYKGVELEFGDAIKAVANEVANSVPQSQSNVIGERSKDEINSRLLSIAELAPRAAILEAWIQVEAAAADLISKKNLSSRKGYVGPSRLRDDLQKANILNSKQLTIFEQLRHLRNEAVHVHDADFTDDSVKNYIESSVKIATYLEDLAQGL